MRLFLWPDLFVFGNWTESECTEECGSLGVLRETRACKEKDYTMNYCQDAETERITEKPCNRHICLITIAGITFTAVAGQVLGVKHQTKFRNCGQWSGDLGSLGLLHNSLLQKVLLLKLQSLITCHFIFQASSRPSLQGGKKQRLRSLQREQRSCGRGCRSKY